jgi:hypothetical protein
MIVANSKGSVGITLKTYISIQYRWTSLYVIDKNKMISLAFNEFAYKKSQNDNKLRDTFQKNG